MKGWIQFSDGHIVTDNLGNEVLEQIAACYQLQLEVVLLTQIVAIMGEAPKAVMDRDDLERFLGEAIEKLDERLGPDVADVLLVQVIEYPSGEIPCELVLLPESDDQTIHFTGCARPPALSWIYEPSDGSYYLRAIITPSKHLPDDHSVD